MRDQAIEGLRVAIATLEGQRETLGDALLALATAPLRARLARLMRPAGLQQRQVTVLFADVVGSTAMADLTSEWSRRNRQPASHHQHRHEAMARLPAAP